VGRSTTSAVVTASIIVIIADFILARALQLILGTQHETQTSIDRQMTKDRTFRLAMRLPNRRFVKSTIPSGPFRQSSFATSR